MNEPRINAHYEVQFYGEPNRHKAVYLGDLNWRLANGQINRGFVTFAKFIPHKGDYK